MIGVLEEVTAKALRLNVPLAVQLDITYRCNERCVHCYLDHHDHGEMTTPEILRLIDEMADAGVLTLTLSGGEIFLRKDLFEIVEHARRLTFCVKLKTNALLIGAREAARLRDLAVQEIQVSIYSHRPEVHDSITLVPGSLKRSLSAIRFLKAQDLKVVMANVLMRQNMSDYAAVKDLAEEIGVEFTLDPTITPMMDGNRSILSLGADADTLRDVFRDSVVVGDVDEFCAIPSDTGEANLDSRPCSAGHTTCYVSPYGDVFPCVQFPLPTGNVRRERFVDIWRHSSQMNEVRSIRLKDLPTCSSCSHAGACTRCPGLAYMEGNMRGPSSQDCQKSFARTGIPSANMLAKQQRAASINLVQIRPLSAPVSSSVAGAMA
jgi:radical SAM protein with 4Fe4S-binding SPASM domain